MSVKYYLSTEVQNIANTLISQFHRHLTNTRISYLFSDKEMKSKGQSIWGQARKISSLNAFLAGEDDPDGPGAFFAIVISKPVWETLRTEQKTALVDHELMHLWVEEKDDGTQSLVILPHDVEGFVMEISRHGLWRDNLQQFGNVAIEAAQRSLYEEQDEGKPALRIAS